MVGPGRHLSQLLRGLFFGQEPSYLPVSRPNLTCNLQRSGKGAVTQLPAAYSMEGCGKIGSRAMKEISSARNRRLAPLYEPLLSQCEAIVAKA